MHRFFLAGNLLLGSISPSLVVLEVLFQTTSLPLLTQENQVFPWKNKEVAAGISNSFRVKRRERQVVPGSRKKIPRCGANQAALAPRFSSGGP